MKKQLTRLMATALSVAMVAANPLTVLARTDSGEEITGNILAYSYDEYVVPTSIQIALNPQGLTVKTRDDVLVEDNEGVENDVYLTSDTNEQIVSLTYGVANLSSVAKNLNITMVVDCGEEDRINFVGTGERINERTDYAISLGLMGASNYIEYDEHGEVDFVNDDVVQKTTHGYVDGPDQDQDADHWDYFGVDFTTADVDAPVGQRRLREGFMGKLSDVQVSYEAIDEDYFDNNFTGGTFVKNNGRVSATVGYSLYEATYDAAADQPITFDTTQDVLNDDIMELRALGGIASFEFVGAMNASVDWTQLDVSSIGFTPIYEFTDVNEEIVHYEDVAAELVSGNFRMTAPNYGNIANVNDFRVNGVLLAGIHASDQPNKIYVTRTEIINAIGEEAWTNDEFLEFTFKIGDVNYRARITQNGQPVNQN